MAIALPDWLQLEDTNWGEDEPEAKVTTYSFYKDSPDGEVILYYDDHAHAYYRFDAEGNRVDIPGVTTVLQIVDKSKPLMLWAVKLAINTIRDGLINSDGGINNLATEDLNMLLEDARTKHSQHLVEAGDVGHIVHNILEQAIKRAVSETDGVITDIDTSDYTDERVVNSVKAAVQWITAHKVKFLLTERKIYSREFEVAGTGDGLALVSSCDDIACCKEHFEDRKDWLDWKTSNKMNTTYPAQTAIYMFAYIEETGERVVGRWVIKLNKETGKLDVLYRSPETFELDLEAFVKALGLSLTWKELEKSIQEQNAERRAILKSRRDAEREAREAQERAERLAAREASKAATKARNEAAKAYYKELRSQGMSPDEAKAEQLKKFPPKSKSEKSADDLAEDFAEEMMTNLRHNVPEQQKRLAESLAEPKIETTKADDFSLEWSITL